MLEIARFLFAGAGVFWFVIGVLAAILTDRGIGPPMVFISERTDTALYGAPPDQVLDDIPQLRLLRHTTVKGTLSGFLVGAGLLTASVAWFGLDQPQNWALVTLTIVGFAVLPYWWVALAPYRDAGIDLTLGDVPPFMWVPAILMPVASLLAWIDRMAG